jgi:hypothetical protein
VKEEYIDNGGIFLSIAFNCFTYFPSCSLVGQNPPSAPPPGSQKASMIVRYGGSLSTGNGAEIFGIPSCLPTRGNQGTATGQTIFANVTIASDGTIVFRHSSGYMRNPGVRIYLWIDFTLP